MPKLKVKLKRKSIIESTAFVIIEKDKQAKDKGDRRINKVYLAELQLAGLRLCLCLPLRDAGTAALQGNSRGVAKPIGIHETSKCDSSILLSWAELKARYATTAHALTEPIDVYSEWIDECELANAAAVADADADDDGRRNTKRRN
uniref:Transcription elongation factor 1 homolog n=1 Tax=Oryza minuta TaxID=63629 RepID=A0A1V1H0S5_ORYMI|nr:hypothetical protein [Oryza minuta]